MPEKKAMDKPEEISDASTDKELTEADLDNLDGGDGGQTTYPPYL